MLINILGLLSGIFCGCSIGLGFSPIFKQPKNLHIQIICGFIGLILIFLIFKII